MNRGSEWRRWEFHLHTPFTKKEDQYTGKTADEKWDNFYSSISNYIGDGSNPQHSICAIAITDYLSIDNYLKVRDDKRLPSSVKLVFPNVELRIKPVATESPINIHCLFDPSIANDLNTRFFSHLTFEYNQNQYNATRGDLIRLGRDFQNSPQLSEAKAYAEGLSQYIISFETLSNLFKQNPQLRNKTIIVVSNKSNDGVSGLRNHCDYFERNKSDKNISQLEATRRSIYHFADMIFSSNSNDIKYFLGEGADSPEIVKNKYGCLMPCIHGCDAHNNNKIFAPDKDRFCWVKADPTFEGLKQVLYEPKERVRISSSIPDNKSDYYVIDRVEFNGNEDFSPDPIYFSDKLTCIIGGKSTGKSLLLHNIATAIDPKQVEKKNEKATTNVKIVPGLKVYWRDGSCSDNKEKQRKIVYIPQTYLNRLSDEEQETTEIDNIIQEIMLQNKQCYDAYQIMKTNIADKKTEVAKTIVEFLNLETRITDLNEQCKAIGDKDSINLEIQDLTKQLEELSKTYDVTENEIKQYQDSVEKIKSLNIKLDTISKEIKQIEEISTVVEIKTFTSQNFSIYRDNILEATIEVKNSADNLWSSKKAEILEKAKNNQKKVLECIKEHKAIVATLQPKMEGNERISKISVSLVNAKERLNKLTSYTMQFTRMKEQYALHLSNLSNIFVDFNQIYNTYAQTVNNNFISSTKELEFSVRKIFRLDQFSQKITDIINNRSINRFSKFNLKEITEDLLLEHSKDLIEAIIDNSKDSLQLKSEYNKESALREILNDWYNVDYVVKMDNDSIQNMSPGKKALVLLRLLISLAESKCPILIDQPEDDLDNRSIYNELIHFIKEKKIDRQIITVTHNANIVLGGDAELVIVANQHGENAPNNKFRFEYRGSSIEDTSPVMNKGKKIAGILNSKGIQEHICEILEGGEQAFELRQHKYHFFKT